MVGASSSALAGSPFEFCVRKELVPGEFGQAPTPSTTLDSLIVVFDLSDIESYNATEHRFEFTSTARTRLKGWDGLMQGHRDFYVRVNGVVIFRGMFNALHISTIPRSVPLVMCPFGQMKDTVGISRGMEPYAEPDPRDDERLIQVFAESGRLK